MLVTVRTVLPKGCIHDSHSWGPQMLQVARHTAPDLEGHSKTPVLCSKRFDSIHWLQAKTGSVLLYCTRDKWKPSLKSTPSACTNPMPTSKALKRLITIWRYIFNSNVPGRGTEIRWGGRCTIFHTFCRLNEANLSFIAWSYSCLMSDCIAFL